MRNLKNTVLFFASSLVFIAACKKSSTSQPSPTSALALSELVVKIGEPLIASTTSNIPAGTKVRWSASPQAINWVSITGDSAFFLFSSAGTYHISATYSNGLNGTPDSSVSTVTVSDTVYNDSSVAHCNWAEAVEIGSGDQISLQPISYSDTGLVFLAHTQALYSYGPSLGFAEYQPDSSGGYQTTFNSVFEFPCYLNNSMVPAVGTIAFGSLSNGTHDFELILNGKVYQGSFVVSPSSCSITWNYTSGITISPLNISKQ